MNERLDAAEDELDGLNDALDPLEATNKSILYRLERLECTSHIPVQVPNDPLPWWAFGACLWSVWDFAWTAYIVAQPVIARWLS